MTTVERSARSIKVQVKNIFKTHDEGVDGALVLGDALGEPLKGHKEGLR